MFKGLRDEWAGWQVARLTAEALVWHHGAEGVRRALDEADGQHESEGERAQAERVARIAGHSYAMLKASDLGERALILEVWSTREGSLIRLD